MFLIKFSSSRLLDRKLVTKEIFSICKVLDQCKSHSQECNVLFWIFNGHYDPYFYVQIRQNVVQYLFGDVANEDWINLNETYVPLTQIPAICIWSFDKVLSDRGLADSVTHIVDLLEVSDARGVPAMEIINACILQFRWVDDKWKHDEKVELEAIQQWDQRRDVKKASELFYRDAFKLVKYIDMDH